MNPDVTKRVQALTENFDSQRILELVTVNDIAEAWVRFHADFPEDDDALDQHPDWWAAQLVMHPEDFTDDAFKELLVKLVDAASDEVLCAIGAGPLECIPYDEEWLAWIEHVAGDNPRLLEALECVSPSCISDSGKEALRQRVRG